MPRSDRGKKRRSYDMDLRNVTSALRKAKRAQHEQVKAKRTEERDLVVLSRAERKRIARARQLPDGRICPVCAKLKMKPKQWVVKWEDGTKVVMCRSCYSRKGA
jgi:hypothetical protein